MRTIFVSERRKLDANQGVERQDPKVFGLLRLVYVWIRQCLGRTNLFAGENNVDPTPRFRVGTVEKHVHTGDVAVDESVSFERGFGCGKIGATNEDVHVLRVADGRLIHARYPQGDRISTGHRVGYARAVQNGGRAKQALTYLFHGRYHSIKGKLSEANAHARPR